ncbi:MAG: hypothetical protein NC548_38315 [Lachnospiraceae bacterium]|nr:hypothetical protein [Lachnospiraceae bacterium]
MGFTLKLTCKNFDSWVSFLGRLAKVGKGYLIKNDVYIAMEKLPIPSELEKYPGKHVIHDPIAIEDAEDTDIYVPNGIYQVVDIATLQEQFTNVAENVPNARKNIVYYRDQTKISVFMGNVEIRVADLVKEPDETMLATANSVSWYADLIEPINEMPDKEWTQLTTDELINIRNNGIHQIIEREDNKEVKIKLTRTPIFCLAGVSRMDTPIALAASYVTLPSDESDVGILRIHAVYKCGQSAAITVDCVHEYLVLLCWEVMKDEY